MYEFKINPERNSVFVTLKGTFTAGEAQKILNDINGKLSQLKEGFTLLTDLSRLEEAEPGVNPFIEEAMNSLNNKRVSQIIRIIPESGKDIGFNIMSLFHYSPEVKIKTYKSFKELVENIL